MKGFTFAKRNKGFTMVELLCSVAILSTITAAVSTALVVTARNYDRGTNEVRMQQEAQFTANRIEGLIIDSLAQVDFDDATDTLTVINPEGEYMIALTGGQLIFSEKRTDPDGTVTMESEVLVDKVTAFKADVSEFASNHTVKLDLGLSSKSSEYKGSYQITSRNGANLKAKTISAMIVAPSEITLEPNQEYTFGYTVLGITNQKVDKDLVSVSDSTTTASTDTTNKTVTLKIGKDEVGNGSGIFLLKLSTDEKAEGTSDPLATKQITVKIRRVEDVAIKADPAGSVLNTSQKVSLKATVDGTNLKKVPGADYDSDYKTPYNVSWTPHLFVSDASGWIAADEKLAEYFESQELPDKHTYEFKLKKAPTQKMKLVVTATATHPDTANKCGIPYGDVKKEISFEYEDPFIVFTSPFKRGDELIWTTRAGFSTDAYRDRYANGHSAMFQWMFRYRVRNADGTYGAWANYRKAGEHGSAEKINAWETILFAPDEKYEIQFIGTVISNDGSKKLLWPIDQEVLDGLRQRDPAWSAGWDSAEPITPASEYGTMYYLNESTLQFTQEMNPYNPYEKDYGIPANSPTVGSEASPIELSTGESISLVATSDDINSTLLRFEPIVEKKVGDSWVVSSANGFGLQTDRGIKIDNIQPHCQGLYRITLKLRENSFKDGHNVDIEYPNYNSIITDEFKFEDNVAYFKLN